MFKKLNAMTAKPSVWSAYTADVLWTDPHVSAQMLSFHLNPDINAASRSFDVIDASVDWLTATLGLGPNSCCIDFGCGPGLYTQRFRQRGVGTVVGVDFSARSLAYANEQASKAGLDIDYRLVNYLAYQDSRQYDLITLVMCDFCALSPVQRETLLRLFKTLLKPGGTIALDVFTDTRFARQVETVDLAKNAMGQFWSAQEYWCVHSSHGYDEQQVWLDTYVIIEAQRQWTVYNWLQHFSLERLTQELAACGLRPVKTCADLCGSPLSEGDEMAVLITHA
ncbi:class I SAM-dependent methyltransferase [Aestuariibacter halophilus]|uniref:Class I SAM-dependent methyltransferase n=1 Tax=Fluctibacter halophilus TaxID=226011 RepID=A0ABS8G4G6_9ALTE|nr:class I SAM-dependent methyltransferase [Aestuariibacter halophilus]MCC2615006.1 class I SAM-dependent methyltransferase [Aestuariibacter halophilus]